MTAPTLKSSRHVDLEVVHAYDNVADLYDSNYQNPICEAEDLAIKSIILRRGLLTGSPIVLDIGCGTGKLLELFPGIEHYVGLDPSVGMLKHAREKFPQHLWTEGVLEDVPEDSVDVAISLFGSLSHSPMFSRECLHLARCMKRGARAFLVLFGPRRLVRHEWILDRSNPGLGIPTQRAEDVQQALLGAGLIDVEITGFVCTDDSILRQHVVVDSLSHYLEVESAYVGRRWPNMGVYLIAEATKP